MRAEDLRSSGIEHVRVGLELMLNEEHPLARAYRVVHFGEMLVRLHAATLAAMALAGSPRPDDVKVAAVPSLEHWRDLGARARARARTAGRVGDTWSDTWAWFRDDVAGLRNLLAHGVAPGGRAANDDARNALDRFPDLGWLQEASARSPTADIEGLSPCVFDVDGHTADVSPVFAWAWINQRWQPVAYRLRRQQSAVFEVLGGPLDHSGARDWGAIPVSGRGASGGNPWIPDAVTDASWGVYGWDRLEATLIERLNGNERVLLHGAPGSGKSALFARLATRISENRQRGQVFAHAFRRGVSVTPWADLALRLAGLLDRRGEHSGLDPDGLAELVSQRGSLRLILLDGLDELDPRDLTRLVEWVDLLPRWISVLCTARPGVELKQFRRERMVPLPLEEWCDWFRSAAPRTCERLLRQPPSGPEGTTGMSQHPWLLEVDRRSGGLPGYLRMCFELMDDRTMGDWAEVPEAGPTWFGRLARLHGLDDAAVGVPAAAALVALAPEPIPSELLDALLPRVAPGATGGETIPRLRALIREQESDDLRGWTPFHESFRDWITSSDLNARARARAERTLERAIRHDHLPRVAEAARWVGRQRVVHLHGHTGPPLEEPALRFLAGWVATDCQAADRLARLRSEGPHTDVALGELVMSIAPLLREYSGDAPGDGALRARIVTSWLANRSVSPLRLSRPIRDLVASRGPGGHWMLDTEGRLYRLDASASDGPRPEAGDRRFVSLVVDETTVLAVDERGEVRPIDGPDPRPARSAELPDGARVLAASVRRAEGRGSRLYVVAAVPQPSDPPESGNDIDYVLTEHSWTGDGFELVEGFLLGTNRPARDQDGNELDREPDPEVRFYLEGNRLLLLVDDGRGTQSREVVGSNQERGLQVGEAAPAQGQIAADSAVGGDVTVLGEPASAWCALHHRRGRRVQLVAVPAPVSHVSIARDGTILLARQSLELFTFKPKRSRR